LVEFHNGITFKVTEVFLQCTSCSA